MLNFEYCLSINYNLHVENHGCFDCNGGHVYGIFKGLWLFQLVPEGCPRCIYNILKGINDFKYSLSLPSEHYFVFIRLLMRLDPYCD